VPNSINKNPNEIYDGSSDWVLLLVANSLKINSNITVVLSLDRGAKKIW
jgi:hypothetical protein